MIDATNFNQFSHSSGYAVGTSATVNGSGIAYIDINKYASTASSISFNVTYNKNKFQTTTGTVTVGIHQHTLAIGGANEKRN